MKSTCLTIILLSSFLSLSAETHATTDPSMQVSKKPKLQEVAENIPLIHQGLRSRKRTVIHTTHNHKKSRFWDILLTVSGIIVGSLFGIVIASYLSLLIVWSIFVIPTYIMS